MEKRLKIDGYQFLFETAPGGRISFGSRYNDARFNCGSMTLSAMRQYVDWLNDCCDEMKGGDEDEIQEWHTVCIFDTTLRPEDKTRVCLNARVKYPAVLFAGSKCNSQGSALTADQCDELAKQLRRVARWDRKRRVDDSEKEAIAQEDKVKALIKEFGVDRLKDIVDDLEPGLFTGEKE